MLDNVREMVRGSEVTLGTVVVGLIVWRVLFHKPAAAKEEEKGGKAKPSGKGKRPEEKKANVARVVGKAPAEPEPEEIVYREDWTFAELKEYNGSKPNRPLLVSIRGQVFDTSTRADMYGPGGPYGSFAGVDASYMLATMNTEATNANKAYNAINDSEKQSLDGWDSFFKGKYTCVGKLKSFTETGDLA
eukprot:CAMPEP_0173437228 /NCGR_PEP_ID=MMETSP1357-20121228/17913_1 /TAXON_ID=77926 /ORGANISM="Hemiselmis rufescens, Strain PCC563" /LENGTH=188 /DNA_ID=CAMNT_0014402393 /DNA_START=91 /DNA_END=657 /DNA_ORIENTATION=+